MADDGNLGLRFTRLWDHYYTHVLGVNLILTTKFDANRSSFEVIFFFYFSFTSVANLDLEKIHFQLFWCLGRGKAKLRVKFGNDRMNGFGVIQVFVNFKTAAGGHLGK